MKSICLIGFMGSGKTTLGKALADELSVNFFDTDEEIVKWRNMDIPGIFESEGEKNFREYESEVFKRLPVNDAVIATGGGIIESRNNREWLKQHLMTVYLKTSFKEIQRRLSFEQNRPLWNQEMNEKKRLYESRQRLYEECANQIIHTDEKTIEELLRSVQNSINFSKQG
ncbi:shikimate kinase [Salinibacillus kushneri]|nr:shikimate kinase [Salinibacillus kushneri]